MKDLLDEQMPERGFRLGWLYALIGIIVLLMAGYFFTKKGNVEPEHQPVYAQEVPVATLEQSPEEKGALVGVESGQERVRIYEMGVDKQGQQKRTGSGWSAGAGESEVISGGQANKLEANRVGNQDAVYEMVVNEVELAERDVESTGVEGAPNYQRVAPVAAIEGPKLDFVDKTVAKDGINFPGLKERGALHLNGQVEAGMVSFPGHPFSGLELGIGATIEKGDSPWSLQVDVGYGRVVHDASAVGFAKQESDLFNSGVGTPTGSMGDFNEFASGADLGLIDPARLDVVLDAINAWDRFYGRMTVSRHIHGGLRLGVGMALQYVADVSHNSIIYYEDTDDAGMIEKQYLEFEERSFNQLGWIRTFIPSALVEVEYRMDPNWSIVGRYEQDLAGIARSHKSSLPYYASDSRLGVGLKWRFN